MISTVAVIFHSRLKLLDGIWNQYEICWKIRVGWICICRPFWCENMAEKQFKLYFNDLKIPIPTWRGLWISALCQPRIGELTLSRCPWNNVSYITDKSRCIHENQWEVFHSKIQASWLISCLTLDRLMLWLVHFFHPGRGGQFQWVETSNEQYLMEGLGT